MTELQLPCLLCVCAQHCPLHTQRRTVLYTKKPYPRALSYDRHAKQSTFFSPCLLVLQNESAFSAVCRFHIVYHVFRHRLPCFPMRRVFHVQVGGFLGQIDESSNLVSVRWLGRGSISGALLRDSRERMKNNLTLRRAKKRSFVASTFALSSWACIFNIFN